MRSKTVVIKADGSVKPIGVSIKRDGKVYTLTDDIEVSGDGIIVGKDDIVINGANHILKGIGSNYGIDLSKRKGVTIKNVWIQNFNTGIGLNDSLGNRLLGNIIEDSKFGLLLYYSSNNEIVENEFINCGLITTNSYNNIIKDNNVNGKKLIYLENESDKIIENIPVAQVILVRCKNIFIKSLHLSNMPVGIELWETSNVRIIGNKIENNNPYGIALVNSSNNSIVENIVKNNEFGIYLSESSTNNKIFRNFFIKNRFQCVIFESRKNIWDDGYPSGGNYWSDYDGKDDNGDGIGDTPYIIDENNRDRYPLIKKLEEEVKKYEEYLEKLEQLRREGRVSDKTYLTLKDKYESEIRKLIE